MKAHTAEFKNEIKMLGRQLDSKITFGNTVLGSDELNAVTPHFKSTILKSAMKQLDIDSNVEIPVGTLLKYEFGVKVRNEDVDDYRKNYDYIDFGNYIVKTVEKQEDTNSYRIVCYDKMLYSMLDYTGLSINYPITVRDYINELCRGIGLDFANKNDTFANYDKVISTELYLTEDKGSLGYTYRDIFDELAQVTASTICINQNDEVEIRYITETYDGINEEYLKSVNVKFGEKFGPLNTVVLSRSGDSDKIYYPAKLAKNPYEIKISDNQIMNFEDRADFLPDIFDKLNGLEFYTNDFASTGICYYDICDRYTVQIGNNSYSCVMFNDEILVTQGLVENVFTELPEITETDYSKADTDDRRINKAYILIDKQKQIIDATIEKVDEHGTALTNIKTTVEGTTTTIKDINDNITKIEETIEGLKTNVETVGGANLIRDSLGALNDKSWKEKVSTIRDTFTMENSIGGQAIILNNDIIEQQIQLPNEVHTLSFYYKKNLSTINAKIYINEVEYELTETRKTLFKQQIDVKNNSVTIKFECDTDNGCYILDLLLNLGTDKGLWTQNINETITDTVKIGKGIQVESSIANTYFRADADGTRVINKTTNEVVREDTDKGTITNEFVSRKTSIVNGILFEKVGNQRWMTGV